MQYFAKYSPSTTKACRELWAQGYGSGTCTEEYNSNVQITATPAAGWAFYRWWGDVYANEAQATVSVDTSMSRVIKAEFVSRPGISSLDLVADLTTFLAQGNIRDAAGNLYTATNFDRNEIDYDENSDRVFVGNGILDAAELALVGAVLKNAALDLSARGGITADQVWAAWQTNIARARLDMVAQSAAVQNVVAGYMTLGDYKSVECIKYLVSRAPFNVTLDETLYNRSRQRFFYWKYDPDNDGLDNVDEWAYASPAGQVTTLAHLDAFLTQSLNGVANAQADGSKGLALGSTTDCPCAATTTVMLLGTPENGTITVNPLGLQPYSQELKVTAKPDPSYTFLGYSTTPATLLSGSKELEMTFSLTAPLSATVNVTGVFWRSYLEVPLNPTSYSITVTGENTVTVDVPEENARRIYGPPNTELKVTLTTASTTPKLVGVEIDYGLTHEAPGFSWQKTFTVVLPEFGRISVQGSFGQTPAETVTFSLESNQGGTVLGAETYSGQTKFSEQITVQKGGPVQFYAVPHPGFEHTGWESLPSSQTGGTVRARFEEIKHWKLDVETGGDDTPCSGYVSVEGLEFFDAPNGVNNAKRFYTNGERLALVAHANPGYCFVRWDGVVPGPYPVLADEIVVTMDQDKTVKAVFKKNVFSLESVTFGGSKYFTLYKENSAAYDSFAHDYRTPYTFPIPARAFDLSPDDSTSPQLEDPICYGTGTTGAAMTATVELNLCCESTDIMIEGRQNSTVVFKTMAGVSASPESPLVGPMSFLGTLDDTLGQETFTVDWYISICGKPFGFMGDSRNPLYRIYPPGPQHPNGVDGAPTAKRVELLVDTGKGLRAQEVVAGNVAQMISDIIGDGHFGPPYLPDSLWSIFDNDPETRMECLKARDLAYECMLMLGVVSSQLGIGAAYPSTDDKRPNPNYNSDATDQEFSSILPGADKLMFDMNNASCSDGTCGCYFGNLSSAENFLKIQGVNAEWYYMSVYPYLGVFLGTGSSDAEKNKSATYKIIDAVRDRNPHYSQMYYDHDFLCNHAAPLP